MAQQQMGPTQAPGEFVLGDDGRLVWVPVSGQANTAPPQLAQLQPETGQGENPFAGISGPDMLRNTGIILGKTAELMSGLVPGSAPVRTALATGSGAFTGALLDEENPLRGMAQEAGWQGGLEGGSSFLAHALPRGMSRLALRMGSAFRGGHPLDVDSVIESLMRIRDRGWGKGLPLGQVKRTRNMIQNGGNDLAAVESSIPGTQDINIFRGTTRRGPGSLHDKQQYTGKPISNRINTELEEEEIINQQIASRGGWRTTPGTPGAPPTVTLPPTNNPAVASTALEGGDFSRRGRALRQGPPPGGPLPTTPGTPGTPPTLRWQTDPNLTARELGEWSRGLRREGNAEGIIQSRAAGQYVPPGEEVNSQVREALAREIRAVQDMMAGLNAGVETQDQLRRLNQYISDLKRIQEANTRMRGQGLTAADLGQWGMRGGLGAGLGGSAATAMGGDYRVGMAAGSAAAIPLLSPANMTRVLGFWGGRGAQMFPTVARGTDMAIDARNQEISRKRVRRRDPQ